MPQENLKSIFESQVKQMKDILDNSLTKSEILEAFKMMTQMISKLKESHKEAVGSFGSKYDKISSDIISQLRNTDIYQEIVGNAKSDATSQVDTFKQETAKQIKEEIEKMLRNYKGVSDGLEAKLKAMKVELTPNIDEISTNITKKTHNLLLPQLLMGVRNGLTQMGKNIVKALSSLKEEDKLPIEAIKGLKRELEALRTTLQSGLGGLYGGGGVGKHNVVYYDLSGSLDGSTKTFTLPAFWKIVDVKLSSVPVMRLTTDYTVDPANSQITFTDEIQASTDLADGQSCVILYSE